MMGTLVVNAILIIQSISCPPVPSIGESIKIIFQSMLQSGTQHHETIQDFCLDLIHNKLNAT